MWFTNFLTSSVGQKAVMSLTGLFLISFLPMHLLGNLQLLIDDGGQTFNVYARFMTTNPLVKMISYLLYASILLHAIQGVLLWQRNRLARGQGYAVSSRATSSFASRNMAWLGIIILVFLVLHLWQFWFRMKMGDLPMVTYEGEMYKNLYVPVKAAFTNIVYVVIYVVSMVVIAYHLHHGFQSAFQTLGLNHKKYTPLIHFLGKAYAVLIPLGFVIIPIYFFIKHG